MGSNDNAVFYAVKERAVSPSCNRLPIPQHLDISWRYFTVIRQLHLPTRRLTNDETPRRCLYVRTDSCSARWHDRNKHQTTGPTDRHSAVLD